MASAGETVTGTLVATGGSIVFQPIPNKSFNVWMYGTFVATLVFQRSFDGGTTWLTVPKPDLTDASFSGPINFEVVEARASTTYRWNVSAYTSGTISYRFAQ